MSTQFRSCRRPNFHVQADRFLEHSRVFVFCNNNDPSYYIGSAVWMPRNLDHRIEVITPVYDAAIQKELWDMIQIQLKDNCKARFSGERFKNRYRRRGSSTPVRAQYDTYNYFKEQSES